MENKAGYFPLFVDLQGKNILIVGAGKIAARRATVLVEFGADVTVVAPEANAFSNGSNKNQQSPWECRSVSVPTLAEEGALVWKRRIFEAQDLNQKFLVLAATNDPAVNDEIARLCHERGIPVNHAGDQSQCDFQFPAIARRDPVVIGINAGGKNHRLVKRVAAGLREWMERIHFESL
ncbi:bifunctional precorrin-2 dehydrogenase/sirohydrochlorin ferrochelatase [Clostridium sp. OM02-18AC]|uniref:precorrin-2 dehydrogenase/sirohydrochlorin ferrochelatase family protein n=1 Tax=Clostridium sp. OM02-18AC TaxID=2292311 RepID=UPI0015FA5318|nr:bifunctional precorrin-2 dehydrogenase/sirohydrochlorin ferrochelatase [Clostridium sp. OM02-18AC]